MHQEMKKNNKQKHSAYWGCLDWTVPERACCHVWKQENTQEELSLSYRLLRWGPWATGDSLSAAVPSVFPQSCLLMRPGDGCAGDLDWHGEDFFSEAVPVSFSGRVLAHLMMSTLGGLELWGCYKKLPRVMGVGRIMQPWEVCSWWCRWTVTMIRHQTVTES